MHSREAACIHFLVFNLIRQGLEPTIYHNQGEHANQFYNNDPVPLEEIEDTKGGNQNPFIEEQTTQWPKEKVQMDKQLYTKHTHKTKDRVTRTPLKIGDELRCSGWVGSSCSTSDIRRVNLVTTPVINHERGMLKNKA